MLKVAAARSFAKVASTTSAIRLSDASWSSGIKPRVSGARLRSMLPLRPMDV
jgi:hypothetical protein